MRKYTIIIAIAALMVSCASFQPIQKDTKLRAIEIGLQELDLDIYVHLIELKRNTPSTVRTSGFVVEGRMSGRDGLYVMQLSNELSTHALTRVIAHELIHAEQFETGKLKWIDAKQMYWKGRIIKNWQDAPHDLRKWEQDAFQRGRQLAYQIRLKLKQ